MSQGDISKRIRNLRYVPKPFKYIVFGFVREYQRAVTESGSVYADKTNHYPMLIGYLCLSYYEHPEFFARNHTHDSIYIATNRVRIIKCIGGDYNSSHNAQNALHPYSTATGIARIPSTHNAQIIKWSVKIGQNMKQNDNTIIGITSDPNCFKFNTNKLNSFCYGLQNDGKIVSTDTNIKHKGFTFKAGDVITISLDLKENKLYAETVKIINDEEIDGLKHEHKLLCVLSENIKIDANIKYSFAISLDSHYNRVDLLDFDVDIP